jgi:hypothetical protein
MLKDDEATRWTNAELHECGFDLMEQPDRTKEPISLDMNILSRSCLLRKLEKVACTRAQPVPLAPKSH